MQQPRRGVTPGQGPAPDFSVATAGDASRRLGHLVGARPDTSVSGSECVSMLLDSRRLAKTCPWQCCSPEPWHHRDRTPRRPQERRQGADGSAPCRYATVRLVSGYRIPRNGRFPGSGQSIANDASAGRPWHSAARDEPRQRFPPIPCARLVVPDDNLEAKRAATCRAEP